MTRSLMWTRCDTSVPHRLVREGPEAQVREQPVRIFHAATLVTTDVRGKEPYA
ncbi:hypothetical protein [Archangium minus]|uniref:hypothetical protein n=1 Tax=Archangium minus TaxID=83450 RepID=UPI0037BE286D